MSVRAFAQTEKLEPALKQRATALGNVTVVESGAQDPVPASARPLDMITIVLAYHDITFETVDRKIMNRELVVPWSIAPTKSAMTSPS